jgi:hypothetical protein
VPRDPRIAGHLERFDNHLAVHRAVDEFGLLLNPRVRVAIAGLAGGECGQLGPVGGAGRLAQILDGLGQRCKADRRVAWRHRHQGRAEIE